MATNLLEHTQTLREPGPPGWAEAVDRVVEVYRDAWTIRHSNWDRNMALALVMGVYLVASTQNIPAGQVTREHLDDLTTTQGWERVEIWARLVERAGHNLDDAHDPVVTRWRHLAEDMAPASADAGGWDDNLMVQTGPVLQQAMSHALAPQWNGRTHW
jgi:hypothetical protein